MPLQTLIINFALDIAKTMSVSALKRGISIIFKIGLSPTEYAHFRELRNKIKDMPFIYRDLAAEVETDFVEVELSTVDLNSFNPRNRPPMATRADTAIRDRRRLLIVGNAGV